MAFRRKSSYASDLSKALLMSAMLMTESGATEVRPCPRHNVTVLLGNFVQGICMHAYND